MASDRYALILEFPSLIDCLGSRLGFEGTEKLLVPQVLSFLNQLQSAELLRCLLQTSLWSVHSHTHARAHCAAHTVRLLRNILLIRAGVKCFLRSCFPVLLTYLSAGTLHNLSKALHNLSATEAGISLPPSLPPFEGLHSQPLHVCQTPPRLLCSGTQSPILIRREPLNPIGCSRARFCRLRRFKAMPSRPCPA